MRNLPPRERCELCQKQIYTHDIILTCNLNYRSYHAKCLDIDNDTALELQSDEQWFCPCCIEKTLPINLLSSDINYEAISCSSCLKYISPFKHRVVTCHSCKNISHYTCISKLSMSESQSPLSLCLLCFESKSGNVSDDSKSCKADELNSLFANCGFDPYNEVLDHEEIEKNRYFDDEIEDTCETVQLASKLLKNCRYFDIDSLTNEQIKGTSLFFNNIDGFQSNFYEFKNQI